MGKWLLRREVLTKRANCVRPKLASGRSYFHFFASRSGSKLWEDDQTERNAADFHVAYKVIRHNFVGTSVDLDDAISCRATPLRADVATGGDLNNFGSVFNGGADGDA
ncbi:hypothetical protein BV911_07635 [Pseudoruegeria sp. SK021]|nr:hypothetical protein BV911_07635 [Pseudoruegeria sp. SK021]